jgi:type IX secretion system PorP/SprF family membrane protein
MILKIKIIKNNFLIICGFVTCIVNAQQNPHYTEYMYNTMVVNPAYAGSTGSLEATLLGRSQWVGIDGSPQTQSFSAHAPLKNKNVGLGLSIINDKIGPSDELYMNGNFSYSIDLGYEKKLSFGLKAGLRMLNIDWSKGISYDSGDVLLNSNVDNKITPSVGAGLYYYTSKAYLGISVPSFIRTRYYDDVEEGVYHKRQHYFFTGGYVFDLNKNLKFKPAFFVKAVKGAPISKDVSANFLIQEKVVLGASYRFSDSVSALAGLQITKQFYIGYAYDYSVTDLNNYNDGSHEIILRYQCYKNSNKIKSPRFF